MSKEPSKIQLLLQEKEELIKTKNGQLERAREEIKSLQSSLNCLLNIQNLVKINSSMVPGAARLILLNDELEAIRKSFQDFDELKPILANECTSNDIQNGIAPIITRWSYALSFNQMLPSDPIVQLSKTRPLPDFRSFTTEFDMDRHVIKTDVDIIQMFDTRLAANSHIRNQIQVLKKDYVFTDILDAYLCVVVALTTFHRLDPNGVCLRYSKNSPTTIDYTDAEQYDMHLVQPNTMNTARPKRNQADPDIHYNISSQRQNFKKQRN